jgi:serine/threonine protein kinase
MTETNRCPRCGAELPADSPGGQCPKCLLQAGYESQAGPSSAYHPTAQSPQAAGFAPPPIDELARQFPQLELIELLGQGGMGAVYKARQLGLDRLVALKILPPEVGRDPAFAERFTREARALARLGHPNIVGVYDFGQRDGMFYIVMEYMEGVNLRQAILAGGMSPPQALAIVPQICDALQFAHDEGVVHRDIKPENILLDKRGRVKIADFGLAKLFGTAADHTLTGDQQVMGTLRYMAPEQMEGTHAVDHRADIYSLGVVFYEMLTGELPIGRFAPPSKKVEVDVRLDDVVLRNLEKEPDRRYQHASQVKSEVEAIRTPVSTPTPAPVVPARPSHQWPVGTVLAALLALTASFMPWGQISAHLAVNTIALPADAMLTGWNSGLTIGSVTIPNWIPPIVALVAAALALLQAAIAYRSRSFILVLACYGIMHAGLMCVFLSANGHMEIGAPATLAAFGAIALATIIPMIANCPPATPARIAAVVAFVGNLATTLLSYFGGIAVIASTQNSSSYRESLFSWSAVATASVLSTLVALFVYLAVRSSKRIQRWVTPIVQGVSLANLSTRTALQAAFRASLIASASGWIGLAAGLLQLFPHAHSPLLEQLSRFAIGVIVSLLLAPIVYLGFRWNKASRPAHVD